MGARAAAAAPAVLLLLVVALFSSCARGAQLRFKLNVRPGGAPPEVAAQAVALFLSAQTGVDFTRWNAATPRGTAGDPIALDLDVDVPDADRDRVRAAVRQYVRSGQLDADFATQRIPGVHVFLRRDAPTPPSATPSPSVQPPREEGADEQSPAPSEAPASSALPSESPAAPDAATSDTPAAESAEPDGLHEATTATTEAMGEAVPSVLAERGDALPAGAELFAAFLLDVHSPEFNFNAGMRDAIKWFLANHTATPAAHWRLWDVIEFAEHRYRADLRLAARPASAARALRDAVAFVRNERLTAALRAAGATDVVVVLAGELAAPSPDIDDFDDHDELPNPSHAPLAGAAPPPARDDAAARLPLFLNVSSPARGFGEDLSAAIVAFCAKETGTHAANWTLREAEQTAPGLFDVQYAVRVAEDRRQNVAQTLVRVVRERNLDRYLSERRFERVSVRLRPHLVTSEKDEGGKKRGAFAPSAATIAASVVGILLVVAIGAAILCLLPRGSGRDRSA